jgi:FKBP-type peptidyl-prolyl cis-trans isomerase (trigger factor)
MNGFVTKLYDVDSITIPAEYLKTQVDAQAIEDEIKALSLRCAQETKADQVAEGDLVRCKADQASYPDHRTILLFTGVQLPGAEEVSKAAVGKHPGDVFTASLAGKTAQLTVEEIIRRVPVPVNDATVASLGMEGVTTVEAYRAYLTEKAEKEQKQEQNKQIMRHYMDAMVNGSQYSYDESEMTAYVAKMKAEALERDPATAEMGDERITESIVYQCKQQWLAEAICKEQGTTPAQEEIEQYADQMAEMFQMVGEAVPGHEELLEMAKNELCIEPMFEYLNQLIQKKVVE